MSDQIDPAFKAAYRETQGQPVDGEPRACTCHPDDKPPVPCAEKYSLSECKASSLVERLEAFAAGCRGSMWQSRDETIRLCDEAATALSEKDRRIGELETMVDSKVKSVRDLTIDTLRARLASCEAALAVAKAQLADMEFLSIEGFISWKEDRRAALTKGGEDAA